MTPTFFAKLNFKRQEFVLTAKQEQVCEAAVKTSEREHQVVSLDCFIELVFNLYCVFMLDILTCGRSPNKAFYQHQECL